MTTDTETAVATPGVDGTPTEGLRQHRRRWLVIVVVVVTAAAGVALAIANPFRSSRSTHPGAADNTNPMSLATITSRPLTSQTQVSATLGYAGNYTVINQMQGTITSLPAVGQIVRQGQTLYHVNGLPVMLLYGSAPAYRTLSEGLTGADVQELNADLVALGDATTAQIVPSSDYFGTATAAALENLQAALGLAQSGILTLGQAIILPNAVRITSISGNLGGPEQPGQPILQATSTSRQVTINLDAAQQSRVKVGDHVTITLPDNRTTPGVVSSVGTVATTPASSQGSSPGSSTPTVTVTVRPTDPSATGSLDQAPVQVAITTASVNDALVVPVAALLALSNGGYAVEVADPAGLRRIVPVSIGLFDDADGLVQVSASGLAARQRVVVPAT
jgi:hypothetical protein